MSSWLLFEWMEAIGNVEALFHQERDLENELPFRWTDFLERDACWTERMQDG